MLPLALFFPKMILSVWDLWFHRNFKIDGLNYVKKKNALGILITIVLNLQGAFGNKEILTCPIHENRIFFYVFVSSEVCIKSVFFWQVLKRTPNSSALPKF